MEHEDKKSNPNTGGEIWINHFTQDSAQTFREQVLAISKADPNFIIPIYIDSYGGNVDSLAKMIETMDEVQNRFITIAMGTAISCGAILLSHGDIRYCGRLSRVMIHNISTGSWGDAYALKADSEETLRMNRAFMGLLAENCGTTYPKLQEAIKNAIGSKEIWLDAPAAKKFNIVDYVGTPNISAQLQWSCEVPPIKPRLNRNTGIIKKRNKSK